jgi:hypothetical protein
MTRNRVTGFLSLATHSVVLPDQSFQSMSQSIYLVDDMYNNSEQYKKFLTIIEKLEFWQRHEEFWQRHDILDYIYELRDERDEAIAKIEILKTIMETAARVLKLNE